MRFLINMSEINANIQKKIKINTKCTCCYVNDGWRCMWEQYNYNDLKEVYGKMIMECFALSWDFHSHEMICEPCVLRLREALNLKIEFLAVQELLKDETISNDQVLIQLEKEKPKDPTTNEIGLDDLSNANVRAQEVTFVKIDDEYNCFEGCNTHDTEGMSDSEKISNYQLARKPGNKKPKKGPRRYYRSTYTFSDLQNAIKAVKAKEMTILKASQTYGVPKKTLSSKVELKDEERGLMQDKNFKLYDEIQTILQYTNALPFKSKTGKYYCAYCSTDGPFFEEPCELRQHTRSTHGPELVARVPHIMKPSTLNEILRMEIADLKCTACDTELNAWNDMLVHFFEAHEIQFDEAYTRIIPYALSDDLKCALCSAAFLNFGLLDAHMNAHYCNYICYDCGDTFLANGRLENHLKIHDVGRYPCDRCGKTFTRELYRSRHVSLVHDHLPQVKCRYCPEKFRGTFARHRHVVERHPDRVREMACEVCDKKFTWKRYYLDHMRKAHSKNYTCSKYNVSFTKKLALRAHLTEKAEMNDPVHA